MDEATTVEEFATQLSGSSDPDQPKEESQGAEETQDDEVDQPEAEESADADEEETEPESSDEYLVVKGDDGQDVKVPKTEALEAWKAGKSMQADYTRKTQELAKTRQEAHQDFQHRMQFAEVLSAEIGQCTALSSRVQQLEGIDWNALHQQDPMQFIALRAELDDTRLNLNRAQGAVNQKRHTFEQIQQQDAAKKQAEVWEHMKTVEPKFASKDLREMFDSAEKYGYELNELNQLTDKRFVHMWRDLYVKAKAYDTLQTKKPAVAEAVKKLPPKVTSSGTAKPSSKFEQGMKAIKGGSVQDFASLLSATRRK